MKVDKMTPGPFRMILSCDDDELKEILREIAAELQHNKRYVAASAVLHAINRLDALKEELDDKTRGSDY